MKPRDKIYTATIGVTGRCNARCSYCHYFKSRSRKIFAYDITDERFLIYMNFIKFWVSNIEGHFSFRFSGGDPMVLGDRLFSLANMSFEITGMKPFILTAGKELNLEWVLKARDSAVSHVFVSVENPINPDPGAPDPEKVMENILKYNSDELPIVPGVCVVPNNCFGHLHEICEWFFDRIGLIPLISEINYGSYKSPVEGEWEKIKNVIESIINDFFHKTQLNLFSSIIPEYAYGGRDPYLFELNLENSRKINNKNIQDKVHETLDYIGNKSYPPLFCLQSDCPWQDFCKNTKWYWQIDPNLNRAEKLRDYCKFKRLISDAYYRTLVDSQHPDTECSLRLD